MSVSELVKVVFLTYIIDEKKKTVGYNIKTQLENGYEYIYSVKKDYIDKLRGIFSNISKDTVDSLDIILIGRDKESLEAKELWCGKCRLYKNEKLIIERAHKLEIKKVEMLEEVYKKYDKNQEGLNDKSTIFTRIFYSDEFYDLIRFKEDIHSDRGQYSILNDEVVDEFIKMREQGLHYLAQRSVYAKRPLGYRPPQKYRPEFQRDRERIINSKAYRRMVDKAQIYTSAKGDHYRTRLTHSIEVSQIAKRVCIALCLNEDLTESIALGHDLGHTPFGHEGERMLNEILLGNVEIDSKSDRVKVGGFKHNYQSIRVVNYLEEKYLDYEGLDLSYQVMEGMLKHTKTKKCKMEEGTYKCDTCPNKCYDIDDFLIIGDKKELYLQYTFPTTLEGQIVALADEIAQRGHDLDDGLTSSVLSLRELKVDFYNNGLDKLGDIISKLEKDSSLDNTREFINKKEVLVASFINRVVDYFVNKLIETSLKNMENYVRELESNGESFKENPYVFKKVIAFEEEDQRDLENLEKIITQRIINSQEVNCFDAKSAYIIKKLFRAYYANPKQLPDNEVARLYREIRRYTKNCTNIRTGNKDSVREEIEIMKGRMHTNNLEEDMLKRKLYIRSIADFIGGMTDNYAIEQYKKLYSL